MKLARYRELFILYSRLACYLGHMKVQPRTCLCFVPEMASYCICSGQHTYSSKSIIYKCPIKGQYHEDKHLIMTTGTI
jgi:hypothetical protein